MKVYGNTEKKNEQYATKANKGRRQVIFEPGDWAWVHMRKERFSARRRKLHPRGDGPFQVLRESIIMLTSWIFQVIFLFFYVGDNSRTNPIEEMGNDENQQAPLKDLLLEQDPRRSKKHLMG
jgi:hypothetical protein